MKRVLNRLRQFIPAHSAVPAALPWWRRVRWISRRWLRRMDWPGVIAIAVLAICPAFYFSAILPQQARLDAAQQSAARLNEQTVLASTSRFGTNLSAEDQLAVFYKMFPDEGSSSLWLEKLVALAAKRGLSLNDGEYKVTREQMGKLLRYQMTLPVKGGYPQIRQFLSDVQGALPVVALENVQFERQKVADPNVEAKIKLVLYLEQAS
jgi:Tfp pilus assembly protein PilO